jgi:carboxyl-terminal processing protease
MLKAKSKIIVLFIFIGALLFGVGVVFKYNKISIHRVDGIEIGKSKEVKPPEGIDFTPLWKTWQIIQQQYVDKKNIDQQKLLEGAIKGLVQSLDDPYSEFLTKKEEEEFEESLSGSFEGIGIEIGIRDSILTVISPLSGTPAEKAGLKAGDKILEINGETTEKMTLEEAVSKIRGPKGTQVKLKIMRNIWDAPKEFTITRAVINVPSVTLTFPTTEIAHLKIHNFHLRELTEFRRAASKISRSGVERIILDLRNNPGGYLEFAIETAGWFLNKGATVVKIDSGNGPEVCSYCKAQGNGIFAKPKYKIVILINEGSASAAEILAGALRDNMGIKIVGKKSFGKGSVQEIINVDNVGAVKLTVAKWFTPNGTDISKVGIEPDILVENTKEILENPLDDLQLQKAKELVKSL